MCPWLFSGVLSWCSARLNQHRRTSWSGMRAGTGVSWAGMRYLPFVFNSFIHRDSVFSVSVHPTPRSIADANIFCLVLWTIYAFSLSIAIFASEDLVWREMFSVSFCLALNISWVSLDLLMLTVLSSSKTQIWKYSSEWFPSLVSNNRKSKSSLCTCNRSVFSPILWYSAHAFLLNGGIFF